jgi:GTP-binding protein
MNRTLVLLNRRVLQSRYFVLVGSKSNISSTQRNGCCFSTVSRKNDMSAKEHTETMSKRDEFKKIPVHPSILQYIEMIGVGTPPRGRRRDNNNRQNVLLNNTSLSNIRGSRGRRGSRDSSSKQDQQQQSSFWKPPPPFGPDSHHIQVIGSVGSEDVKRIQDESDEEDETDYRNEDDNVEKTGKEEINANNSNSNNAENDNDIVVKFPTNRTFTPEVALAGRSNVGKSTLLNALLYGNRDADAVHRQFRRQRGRTPANVKLPKGVKAAMSNRPGETRRITFYQLQSNQEKTAANNNNNKSNDNNDDTMIESRRMMLVDLPGYGFAYASEKDKANFQKLITDYLLFRGKALKRVLILVDARHGMKKADVDFLDMLQQTERQYQQRQRQGGKGNISKKSSQQQSSNSSNRQPRFPSIQMVLTKCDLVSQTDLARRVSQVRQQLSDCLVREPSHLPVMLVSARAGVGYNNVVGDRAKGGVLQLQKELASLALPSVSKKKKPITAPTKKTIDLKERFPPSTREVQIKKGRNRF